MTCESTSFTNLRTNSKFTSRTITSIATFAPRPAMGTSAPLSPFQWTTLPQWRSAWAFSTNGGEWTQDGCRRTWSSCSTKRRNTLRQCGNSWSGTTWATTSWTIKTRWKNYSMTKSTFGAGVGTWDKGSLSFLRTLTLIRSTCTLMEWMESSQILITIIPCSIRSSRPISPLILELLCTLRGIPHFKLWSSSLRRRIPIKRGRLRIAVSENLIFRYLMKFWSYLTWELLIKQV